MPGLGGRFSTVVKAKISKMLDRAEDPQETLDYSYEKQLELLQNVKKGIADVVTSKKRLQLQSGKLEQQVVKLDTQARQALSAGREDLARAAMERKVLAQTELQSLDTQVKELEDQQQRLIENEQKLRTKIEAFRTKKEVIKAQYSAAEAQVQISEAATGVGEQMADVGLAMQRAVDKTEQMRARASAVEELEAAGTFEDITALGEGSDDIDRQLKELTSASAVDDELAKMRAELGTGAPEAPAGELGAGTPEPDAEAAPAEPTEERPPVIVRIATEGQFELDQADYEAVNTLDNQCVEAVEAGDEAKFQELFAQLIKMVRDKGRKLGDDELVHSDVILPPEDTDLEEAKLEFTGEGAIPDSLLPGAS